MTAQELDLLARRLFDRPRYRHRIPQSTKKCGFGYYGYYPCELCEIRQLPGQEVYLIEEKIYDLILPPIYCINCTQSGVEGILSMRERSKKTKDVRGTIQTYEVRSTKCLNHKIGIL